MYPPKSGTSIGRLPNRVNSIYHVRRCVLQTFVVLTSSRVISISYIVTESDPEKPKQLTDQEHLYRAIGAKIREVRKEKQMKQETLALSIGLTRTSLANIEGGRQRFLLHTLFDIARTLDVTGEELLVGRSPILNEIDKNLARNVKEPGSLAFFERTMRSATINEPKNSKQNPPGSVRSTQTGANHSSSS